jgi:DNA primase
MHSFNIPDICEVDVLAVMGSMLSVEQADMLAEIGQRVIFFFDGDKAGKGGVWGNDKTEGGIHMMSRACRTFSVEYPRGIMDPDDLDADQLCDMIMDAKEFVRSRSRVGA